MRKKTIPKDIHPDLTEYRLLKVANLIREQRQDVLYRSERVRGDNSWSIGCRAYSWTCHALNKASLHDHPYSEWLSIVEDKGLYFTFSIGSVPIKFYRGDPNNPPVRASFYTSDEFLARQSAFSFNPKNDQDFVLRLIIETNHDDVVSDITLVQIDNKGCSINQWPIPENIDTNVKPLETRKITMPKPRVKAKKSTGKKSKESNI